MAEKLFYSMGEVAEMFDVNASLIRHWESQFSVIRPKRNKKGNRLFSPQDVENLKLIYHLVKERGMTLEGAKKALKQKPAAEGGVQRCVERAIRGGIALYACHTNLDSAPGGMSWRLAEMLGVGDLRVLQPAQADEKVGFGVVGELPEPMATVEFMRRMQRVLGVRVVRHSDIASPEVRRVAVCTGAGASMIGDARRAGADIYVTADMKYNDFMTPDKALTVADIGHFESEYCAIQILFDILSKNLITFAVRKSESSRNPVNYLV